MSLTVFFALNQSRELGEKIAAHCHLKLSPHEEREFDDGEHKIRPLIDVRGLEVLVIHSLYSDDKQSSNDKLCRLLFFIGALHDAGANNVTALLPYLAYARKDQKTKPFDPTTTRYIANLFTAVGTDRVITLGAHNPAALENGFQCLYSNIDARSIFVDFFASSLHGTKVEKIAIVAPDSGAIKNAQKFRNELGEKLDADISLAIISKTRSSDKVTSSAIYGDIHDRTIVIYDDMISSGTTVKHAIEACERQGTTDIYVAATHGVFTQSANDLLKYSSLKAIVTTDSISYSHICRESWDQRLVTLDCAKLLATSRAIGP